MKTRFPRFQSRWLRLEDRLTPAISTAFNPNFGQLTITSDGGDMIVVDRDAQTHDVTLNGTPIITSTGLTISSDQIQCLTVYGGAGPNFIDLSRMTPVSFVAINTKGTGAEKGRAISIDAGGGDDTITSSPIGGFLSGGAGSDKIIGGDGPDNITLDENDQDCDGGGGEDRVSWDLATAKKLDITSDTDARKSMFSWTSGQLLTISNAELFSITISGSDFGNLSLACSSGTGNSVTVGDGRVSNGTGSQGLMSIDVSGPASAKDKPPRATYDLATAKKCAALFINGSPGSDTFTINPGAVPVMISGGAGSDQMVVNNYGFPSTVSSSSVQVTGLAPVAFSDVETASSRRQFFDGDAIADLASKGITFSATTSAKADGSQTNTVTLTNSGSFLVSGAGYDLKMLKKFYDDSSARFIATGAGGGPHVRFVAASPGTSIIVIDDRSNQPRLPSLMMTGESSISDVIFTGPSTLMPGASMTGNWNDPTVGGQNRAYSCVVSCTIGNDDYQFEISSFFETGDKPTQSQFASLLDSSAKTPSNGASNVVAVDASGLTQVVVSSATGVDPSITTLTPGQHLYVGGTLLDRSSSSSSSSGNGQSGKASVSSDGRWVVFQSTATNLDSNVLDANGQPDVFLFDMVTARDACVSRIQLGGETANGKSFDPKISANGEYVTFLSLATNLVPGLVDTNGEADLFRYDVSTGALECLSVVPGGGHTCNKGVLAHDLDGEGDIVCWLTEATDLTSVPSPPGLHRGRYAYGGSNDVTVTDPSFNPAAHTYGLTQSPDGSSVYVWTSAPLLLSVAGAPDTNGQNDIVRIDIASGASTLISGNTAGTGTADGASPSPGERCVVNFDGSVCAFTSTASNLVGGVSAPATQGLYMCVFGGGAGGGPQVKRVDQFANGQFGGDNHTPSISADGSTIAFSSTNDYTKATPSTSSFGQIFVCYTVNNRIIRSSSTRDGQEGNAPSSSPLLCSNGQCVTYSSQASNLVPGDINGQLDAFTSLGHHLWTIDLQAVSFPFQKVEIKYKGQDDRYVAVDVPTGTELSSCPAAGVDGITIYGRDNTPDDIVLNFSSGLTRIGSDVSFFGGGGGGGGGGGSSTITVDTLLMPALMKAKEKANRTKCSLLLQLPLDGGPPDASNSRYCVCYTVNSVQWVVQSPPSASVQFDSTVDVGLTSGSAVSVSRSNNDLVIDNGYSSFTTTSALAVGTPRDVVIGLTPYGDSCTASVAGNPIPGVGIVVKGRLGNDLITAAGTTAVPVTIDGGDGDDDCTGGSKDDTMVISQGVDHLSGGGGNDVYARRISDVRIVHPPGTPPGTWREAFDVTISDSSGTNTLDFSDGPPITMDLSKSTAQYCCPTCRIQLPGSPFNFIGSEFSDTVQVTASSLSPVISGGDSLNGTIGDVLVVDAQGHAACDLGGKFVFSGGLAPISHNGFESAVVINNAPTLQVASVIINDGSKQRSRVNSVTVAFNGFVDFGGLPVELAFKVAKGSSTIPLNASVSNNNGFPSVTLTFHGAGTEAGSLADGRYTLTVSSGQVFSAAMGPLDGNADGMPGDDYVLDSTGTSGIFRLFGDSDGNALVDGVDFGAFRTAFNTNSFAFDIDGSGVVDGLDFGQFRFRFGVSL